MPNLIWGQNFFLTVGTRRNTFWPNRKSEKFYLIYPYVVISFGFFPLVFNCEVYHYLCPVPSWYDWWVAPATKQYCLVDAVNDLNKNITDTLSTQREQEREKKTVI